MHMKTIFQPRKLSRNFSSCFARGICWRKCGEEGEGGGEHNFNIALFAALDLPTVREIEMIRKKRKKEELGLCVTKTAMK